MAQQIRHITHYIPPATKFLNLEKEFVEPNPSDHFIYWLFRYRCIVCKKNATEINEINLRSRSKKNILDWRNRVTLCQEHHTGDRGFHHNGVSNDKIKAMQELRKEYLISVDREQYV